MNCHEFSSVLDEHPGLDELSTDKVTVLEMHAAICEECTDALASYRALRMDPIPAMQTDLDLSQFGTQGPETVPTQDRRARRVWRSGAVLSVIGLGGAVFAGVALVGYELLRDDVDNASVQSLEPTDEGNSTSPLSGPDSQEDYSLIDYIEEAELEAQQQFSDTIMSSQILPDGEMFLLLRIAPLYPPAAAAEKLEGSAVVEYTVTENGDLTDIAIVESSDPVFEQATIDAIRQTKYKPRVVGGRAVAVEGVRNRYSYAMEPPSSADDTEQDKLEPDPEPNQDDEMSELELREYGTMRAPIFECLESGDFDCIQLNLDYMAASADLNAEQEAEIWRIYGFVYHRQGNYERAIEAYEKAARSLVGGGYFHATPLMTIARIHYEQHQYQQALNFAIEYLKASSNPSLAAHVFVDHLRQLGATVQ